MSKPEVTAIIPARAGSKGIPGKNRRIVADYPLWRWSLRAAAYSVEVKQVVVTTDDLEILQEAQGAWCRAVQRPPELATDDAPLDAALLHALDALGIDSGILVTLQPTVPVRREGLIDDCVRLFRAFPDAKSLVTVNRLHFVYDVNSGVLLNPPRVNRQQMKKPLCQEDGSVFVCRIEDFRASGTRVMDPVTLFETERTVDIDTPADLELAEFLLTRGQQRRAS